VDVTGIEPATPCLQSPFRKVKQLVRLAFTPEPPTAKRFSIH
jgi:hypothetical protein